MTESLHAHLAARLLRRFEEGRYDYGAMEALPVEDEATVEVLLLPRSEWRAELARAAALGRATVARDRVVPALLGLLGHEESSVREAAAVGLGRQGTGGAAIVAMLRSEDDPLVVREALLALGSAGDGEVVVPFLLDRLARVPEPDHYRWLRAIVAALGGLAAPGVVPALTRVFSADRAGVLRSLGRLGALDWELALGYLREADNWHEAAEVLEVLAGYPEGHQRLLRELLDRPHLPEPPGVPDGETQLVLAARLMAPVMGASGATAMVCERVVRLLARCERLEEVAVEAVAAYEAETHAATARQILHRLGRPPAVPADGWGLERLTCLPLEGRTGERPVLLEGRWHFPYHRVLAEAPAEDWATDADVFGLVELDGRTVKHHPLPWDFPIQPTGAAGAKRVFRLMFAHEGRLVCTLQSPFSDERGWGNDNVMVTFSAGRWERERLCHGEPIIWIDARGRLRHEADDTPYHLDDWEMSPETRRALTAARNAEQAPLPAWELVDADEDCWRLRAPDGSTLALYDLAQHVQEPSFRGALTVAPGVLAIATPNALLLLEGVDGA